MYPESRVLDTNLATLRVVGVVAPRSARRIEMSARARFGIRHGLVP